MEVALRNEEAMVKEAEAARMKKRQKESILEDLVRMHFVMISLCCVSCCCCCCCCCFLCSTAWSSQMYSNLSASQVLANHVAASDRAKGEESLQAVTAESSASGITYPSHGQMVHFIAVKLVLDLLLDLAAGDYCV